AFEAEAQLENPPLAFGKRLERTSHALAAERLFGLVERIGCLAVGEQIAELALVVGAHRLVEGGGRVRGSEPLVDALHREAGRLGELFLRRLAPELDLEPPRRARQLLLALDDVDGHADRTRVVRNCPLYGLPDPPGGVGRELVAAAPIELLDSAIQAERPLLDQVEERNAKPAIALGDGDDKPKIRLDHVTLC